MTIDQRLKRDREYLRQVNMHKSLEEFVVKCLKERPDSIYEYMIIWAADKAGKKVKVMDPNEAEEEEVKKSAASAKAQEEETAAAANTAEEPAAAAAEENEAAKEENSDEERKKEDAAATKIQAIQRGRQDRKAVEEKKKVQHQDENDAGANSGEDAKNKEQEGATGEAIKQEQDAAATKIQSIHRGRQTRKEVQSRLDEKKAEEVKKAEDEQENVDGGNVASTSSGGGDNNKESAAMMIQNAQRRRAARDSVDQKRAAKANK